MTSGSAVLCCFLPFRVEGENKNVWATEENLRLFDQNRVS